VRAEARWEAVADKGFLAETCAPIFRTQKNLSLVDRRDSTRSLFFAHPGASRAFWMADSFSECTFTSVDIWAYWPNLVIRQELRWSGWAPPGSSGVWNDRG